MNILVRDIIGLDIDMVLTGSAMKIVDMIVNRYDGFNELLIKFDDGYTSNCIFHDRDGDEMIGLKMIQYGNEIMRKYWNEKMYA